MKPSIVGIISALAFAVVLLVPAPTYAASATFFGPIIPKECKCDNRPIEGGSGTITTAPDFGCALQVVQNLINFGITLSTILFTVYLVITGFSFITSAGSSEARSKAKVRFTNVFVGLVVLLCAWLLVDFVMKTIYDEKGQFGPWNAILAGDPSGKDRCIVAKQPTAISVGSVLTNITSPAPGTTAPGGTPTSGGGSCTPIPDSGLASIGAGFQLNPDAAQRFNSMKAAASRAGVNLVVTSAYRSPEYQLQIWNKYNCSIVNGKSVCQGTEVAIPCSLGGTGSNHTRGTAVDIGNSAGQQWVRTNGAQYGFINRLPGDPVHFSDTGS